MVLPSAAEFLRHRADKRLQSHEEADKKQCEQQHPYECQPGQPFRRLPCCSALNLLEKPKRKEHSTEDQHRAPKFVSNHFVGPPEGRGSVPSIVVADNLDRALRQPWKFAERGGVAARTVAVLPRLRCDLLAASPRR